MTGDELYDWWNKEFEACGCGNPDDAAVFLYLTLELLHDLSHVVWKAEDRTAQDQLYAAWEVREKALMPSSGVRMFVYYRLFSLELTEHGGAVPGWLAQRGYEVLEALREYGTDPDHWQADEERAPKL